MAFWRRAFYHRRAMTPALTALALALLLALPGAWLLLRPRRLAAAAGTVLLVLATAAAYTGVRLWREMPAPPAPFALTAAPGHFQVITAEQLPAALAASRGRPVLLEFYADWCPSCIVWKEQVFSRPEIQAALAPVVLLQVDATDMTPATQALLEQHGLAGLPALLVFGRDGRERPALRLLGEMEAAVFHQWIEATLLPSV